MNAQPTLAAVVLTLNEQSNIVRCLQHLRWADDLVVVDSGSTDATVRLAGEQGARVVVHVPSEFVIADQRNWALGNVVNTQWAFFIDADEVATEALAERVREVLSHSPSHMVGYRLCPKVIYMDRWLKHVCQFPSWHDRLIKAGHCRFEGGVWERFACAEDAVGYIREPYLHYAFDNGFSAWVDRHNRYSTDRAKFALSARQRPIEWSSLWGPPGRSGRGRRRALEAAGARLLWLSPGLRFVYLLLFRLAIFDGWPGIVYAMMMMMFQFMICVKVMELEQPADQRMKHQAYPGFLGSPE